MYFNPMAQYMPNYMYGSFGGMTSQKSYPVKLDLKPRHANDILAIGGFAAASVGLCLIGNIKGAKATAEAAVKTAAKSTKGGFWSKLFAKKGVEKAIKYKQPYLPGLKPNLWNRITGLFSKKSKGIKEVVKKGTTKTGKQTEKVVEQWLPGFEPVAETVEVAKKPKLGVIGRANSWFWDKTCGLLDKAFGKIGKKTATAAPKGGLLTRVHSKIREFITPKGIEAIDKFKTPQSLVASLPVYQRTGNIVADMQKMLQKLISGEMEITQINEILKTNNLPLITLGKGKKANIKAVKTYIKNLQNYKGQAFREVVQDCKKAVSTPIVDVAV